MPGKKPGGEWFNSIQVNVKEFMIAKKDLINGVFYKGSCRNSEQAQWVAERDCFEIQRTKFGQTFPEDIKHPDDEAKYDVFTPLEKI